MKKVSQVRKQLRRSLKKLSARKQDVGELKVINNMQKIEKVFKNFDWGVIEKQRCFENAMKVCALYGGYIVAGQVVIFGLIPIDHYWNCILGKHYDFTFAMNPVSTTKYTELFKNTYDNLKHYMYVLADPIRDYKQVEFNNKFTSVE